MWSAPPSRVSGLFAQQVAVDLELVILAILLIGMIVGAIILVVRVRSWRREDPPLTVEEQLQSFQALVEKGELEVRELERIKAHLEQAARPPVPNPDGSQPPV
jgi:uncharacterized protein YneF (UPF0154 family)